MLKTILFASFTTLAASTQASALTIDFSQLSGDTLTADQKTAFRVAADAWSHVLSDDVTVSVQIGFSSLGSGILGSTSASELYVSSNAVRSALQADSKTTTDAIATASLASANTSTLSMTTANAKALGLPGPTPSGYDGTIQFNSAFDFSSRRNTDGSIRAGSYDLIGIAEHEIGHLLGFVSGVDGGGQTTLDLFRYASPGTLSFASGAAAYFSIDGGTTRLASFATGLDDQASHWLQGTLSDGASAVMNPEVGSGTTMNVTALDIQALDAIGWDAVQTTVSAVPLPASAPLFGAALIGLALVGHGMRRRA